MKLTSMFCVLFASLALAQPQSPVREESVYSFPSYVVSNDKLELAVAARGGAMLRLLLQGPFVCRHRRGCGAPPAVIIREVGRVC
jgi:hypothetical protein